MGLFGGYNSETGELVSQGGPCLNNEQRTQTVVTFAKKSPLAEVNSELALQPICFGNVTYL